MRNTREAILDQALKLFSERGIKETTVRDIAKAVGITEGAIYRHFSSKDQIVHELFKRYSEQLYDSLEEAIRKGKSREEQFKGMVEAFLDFTFKNPDAFRYLNIFHYLRSKDVKKFKKIPFSLFKEVILDLEKEGLLKIEPNYALAILTGTLERVFLYKGMGIIKGRKGEVKGKVADTLWNVLVKCGKGDYHD